MTAVVCLTALLGVAGCTKSEKVWIVVDLRMPNGTTGQMSFDNPSVPDMTIADCEGSLDAAMPTLMRGIRAGFESADTEFVSAKCVASNTDPIKPS